MPLPRKRSPSRQQRDRYERIPGHTAPAEGDAREGEPRARLRDAVLRYDRARSVRGRRDDVAATRMSKGPVDARWTLLDYFDSDGKRFVIAALDDAVLDEPELLSERERQVLRYAALEYSNKEIAYELGLAAATVRVLMVRAARKLGARGRADAIARFRRPAPQDNA